MLMRGDLDLTTMQAYAGSPNDVLRTTMLNQEVLFKNQVHELHHLYRIQKTLMQNRSKMEFGRYNFGRTSVESTMLQFRNSTREEPMDLLEGCNSVYDKIQPRTPDHGLPSDERISHIDPEELKLSLSIQPDNRKTVGCSKRSWFDAETHSGSQQVIDLEESIERTSNEDLEQSPSFRTNAPIKNFRGMRDSKVSVLLDYNEWNPFSQGLKRCSGGISMDNLSTGRQHFSSCEAGLLDLNKIQHDDSSCLSNDPPVAHPSTASSSHDFHGLGGKVEETTLCFGAGQKQSNNGSNETSETFQKDDAGNFAFMISKRKVEGTDYFAGNSKVDTLSRSETGHVSLEAVSGSKIDLHEAVGCNNNGNDWFIMKLLNSRIRSCDESKKPEQDGHGNVSSEQDGHGNVSSASSKSCCIIDNESSSIKTMQSEVEHGNSNPFSVDQLSVTHVGSHISEPLVGEQEQRSSDSSELDVLIREAAEALVGISLETSSCSQDFANKVGSNKIETKESERPQCSSDFFELMTLSLTECNADDYCVSSKPPEVDYSGSKDFGFKLRRGRRMKDFQRDILPSLASLSRHEICEDINIMEAVLRSREYKKIRGKMADGNSWCAAVRNKSSRANHVPRKKKSCH